jgi:hypothetical protein
MPYSAETLRGCVLELEASDTALPKFEDGYQQWRSAFDEGQAGVWTLPVKEAIAAMEPVMNH